ncbi:hypothetical protein R3P38DRAFT_2780102 [Favolaschia claudopus]|uniref:Uncharacterized protein n=1 Tax=Favolaschia claudopus TaxID=2862362 RepID=A0AAW0BC01_9AGAR
MSSSRRTSSFGTVAGISGMLRDFETPAYIEMLPLRTPMRQRDGPSSTGKLKTRICTKGVLKMLPIRGNCTQPLEALSGIHTESYLPSDTLSRGSTSSKKPEKSWINSIEPNVEDDLGEAVTTAGFPSHSTQAAPASTSRAALQRSRRSDESDEGRELGGRGPEETRFDRVNCTLSSPISHEFGYLIWFHFGQERIDGKLLPPSSDCIFLLATLCSSRSPPSDNEIE